jgi:hypothetical protein
LLHQTTRRSLPTPLYLFPNHCNHFINPLIFYITPFPYILSFVRTYGFSQYKYIIREIYYNRPVFQDLIFNLQLITKYYILTNLP